MALTLRLVRRKGISILAVLFLIIGSYYVYAEAKSELTECDITSIKEFRADKVTVFGVSLGMTKEEALPLLNADERLIVKQDKFNPTWLCVYDKNPDGSEGEQVLQYVWKPTEQGLSTITIFETCSKYLKGNTKRLLTLEVLDPHSDFSKSFLGYPNRSEVTANIPELGLKHTSYYYDAKWLKIVHKQSEGSDSVIILLGL